MTFKVVIPARYASSRLPGKPLLDIAGKPMVVRVVEQAIASGAAEVIVATDHKLIRDAVAGYGYDVIMTKADHASGTDRIAEVVQKQGWNDDTIIVNVQGDEPLIDPVLIGEVASNLAAHTEAAMSTACHTLHDTPSILNPNIVKVVLDHQGHALYFSRAPIPYPRDAFAANRDMPANMPIYRHIGVYAYRAGFLRAYAALTPSIIEHVEMLEQLRVLWHGYKISVEITEKAPAAGVDTEADLAYVRAAIISNENKPL